MLNIDTVVNIAMGANFPNPYLFILDFTMENFQWGWGVPSHRGGVHSVGKGG